MDIWSNTHTSIVDPVPEINRNGRALTVLFEREVAWEAEFVLEVSASLRRADSVYDKSQGVEIGITTNQVEHEEEFFFFPSRLWKQA